MNTKRMKAAINELIQAASKFMPNDRTIEAYDALARDDGKPRTYGNTCNLKGGGDERYYIQYTDHDAVRLRNAVDDLKKLLGPV